MSPVVCAACGTAHAPQQRYCLACGAVVGARALDLAQAIAYRREAEAPSPAAAPRIAATPLATAPAATSLADAGLWRRPATSILTAVALATGLTAGYLLDPQDGTASGAPVVASIAPAATTPAATTDTTPATTATTAAAPAAGAAAPVPAAGQGAAATPSAADATPGPAATAVTPVSAVSTPSPADAAATATPASTPSATSTTGTTGTTTKGTASTGSTKKDAAKTPAAAAKTQTAAAAAGLPKIDHVWVIGIASAVTARDGGYLGETLLARGTELPKYAPGATDPLAGAADLIAGRAPSATAKTLVGQLTGAKRSWRTYAPGTPGCGDAPGTNPFSALPSVLSAPGCADGTADLSALPADLTSADDTPAFSYVATDPALDPVALDDQLRQVVEPIRASAAYRKSGLIAIVPTFANPAATTGALLLSPFAAGATSVGTTFGPYSLLRTVEDLFGLDRLGHAADDDVRALGPDVLTPED